ncbi:MAG: hypothetical protein NTV34_17900, partial [Proteobacteria bacterium]|nr:hypothetical protein [Pseudomonadota bacterium]
AFGKTGTTNDYTNAYFAGFFPVPTVKGAPLDFNNFYTIASYVGYDLNKMMRRGGVKVSGGIGALPTWIEYAKGMMDILKYKDYVDELDISVAKRGEWPMKYDDKLSVPVAADLARGIVLSKPEGDGEVFETTNIAKTGETFFNEFAIGNTVKSVVRSPSDGRGGIGRFFSPFIFKAELKDSIAVPIMRVEVSGSPTVVPDSEGAANSELLPGAKPADIKEHARDEVLDDDGRVIRSDEPAKPVEDAALNTKSFVPRAPAMGGEPEQAREVNPSARTLNPAALDVPEREQFRSSESQVKTPAASPKPAVPPQKEGDPDGDLW